MPIMLHPTTRRPLIAPSGKIAISQNCCCDNGIICCDCQRLQDLWDAGTSLNVAITGGMIGSGAINKHIFLGSCAGWLNTINCTWRCDGAPVAVVVLLKCNRAKPPNNIEVNGSFIGANCGFSPPTIVSFQCNPVRIVFTHTIINKPPGTCLCGEGEVVTFTITE